MPDLEGHREPVHAGRDWQAVSLIVCLTIRPREIVPGLRCAPGPVP